MTKWQGVGLVTHADFLQTVLARVFESIDENALHTLSRVDVFLHRNLVRRIALEVPPHSNVRALGILPENHEIDVLLRSVFQGTEPGIQ